MRKIDMGYSRALKTWFLRSLWNLSWEYKCIYMLFRTLFKWPNRKKYKFEKKIWPEKCARLPRNFVNHTFQKIIFLKKSNWNKSLKFWYKHPYCSPIDSEKSQNDPIYIKTAIREFAGRKSKDRQRFFKAFFFLFCQTSVEYIVFAGPKVFYPLNVYPWGFLVPFSESRYVP